MASCWCRPSWRWEATCLAFLLLFLHQSASVKWHTTLYFFKFLLVFLHPGHRRRSLPQPDGAVRGGALQLKQELLYAAGGVAEGGAAASRLSIVSDHGRTEGKLFQSDSQVSVYVFVFFLGSIIVCCLHHFNVYVLSCFFFFTNSSLVQRAGQQAADEGDREGVYVTVPRAPRHRVRCRVLSTLTRRSSATKPNLNTLTSRPIDEDAMK